MQYETSTEIDTKTVQTIVDCFQEGVFTDVEIQELLNKSECAAIFKGIAAISAQTKEINTTAIEGYRMLRWGRTLMSSTVALLVLIAAILIYWA